MRGGTSRHLADVVRYAAGVEHHVAVPTSGSDSGGAIYDAPALARIAADGGVVHTVAMSRRPVAAANAAGVAGVVRLARSVRPDVVHGHSSVGGAVARLAGSLARVPVAYTANGVATAATYRVIERALGPLTWRWIAVSPSEAALARAQGLKRVVVIPNGIPPAIPAAPSGVSLRSRLGLSPGTPLVGTVARLVAQKSPVDFVSVAAAVSAARPDAHFVLIGMGPLQSAVSAAVAESGLGDRWHQVEHLPDAGSYLGELDVFVLASRFEGAPYTPLEAMAAGVPVVLTDVVGSRDCVEDGRSGLLCPVEDISALGDAVRLLLDSPRRRQAMGAAGRRRVEERFDVAQMGQALVELYRSAGG